MKDHTLFFIAVLCPEDISDDITSLKEIISQKYNTRKALNSPPHITLVSPFWYPTLKRSALVSSVSQLNNDFRTDYYSIEEELEPETEINSEPDKSEEELNPFIIKIDGFGFFAHNVLYLNVEGNQSLENMREMAYGYLPEDLKQKVKKHNPYTPHITLAMKDINDTDFQNAKSEYLNKEYNKEYELPNAQLLEHEGKKWRAI